MSQNSMKVVLSTGNILDLNDLIRKAGQNSAEELAGSVDKTVESLDLTIKNEDNDVIVVRRNLNKILPDERDGIKVTVKLFAFKCCPLAIKDAVERVCQELDAPRLDLLILAPPADEDLTLKCVQPCWRVVEELVQQKRVFSVGIADCAVDLFIELYDWAKVKPSTVQVNLSSCCVVPAELTSFAKERVVQVLTHNDGSERMMTEEMTKAVIERSGNEWSEMWNEAWVARYRAVQQHRGVLESKGYILAIGKGE